MLVPQKAGKKRNENKNLSKTFSKLSIFSVDKKEHFISEINLKNESLFLKLHNGNHF